MTNVEPPRERLTIGVLMALIAGAAVGLCLVASSLREAGGSDPIERGVLAVVGLLGGLSLVGPPLLLMSRRRRRGGWGGGRFLWFVQGTATWLMWPPVVYKVVRGGKYGDSMSGVCYYWGTPLMAVYVAAALLAGGSFQRSRRRRARRSWREQFGLILGLAWACTGLYLLSSLYRSDFGR